jgi:antitoxin component YwqK of YwqJK toxin-antitoxin module
MNKCLIFWMLVFNSSILFGQEKYVIGESENVTYNPEYEYEGIDSVVYVNDNGNYCQCDNIEVYYDNQMENLAYKSYQQQDSCYNDHFWRNGQLKKHVMYVKMSDGFPTWWYSEVYCSNGQLIFKGPSPNQPQKKHYVNYYCNGNKKSEFDHVGIGAEGKMTMWYENGEVKSEFWFENHKETGEWRYYNVSGDLEKVEFYNQGELIEMKKY